MPEAKHPDWPREVEDAYERVRPLGEGAYGVVWLARARNRQQLRETAATCDDDDSVDSSERKDTLRGHSSAAAAAKSDRGPSYVAIKQIHAEDEGERAYAAREIAILSEVDHPNIVRCLLSAEIPRGRLVVLTLADGPNLNDLVEAGGALSVSLARLAARHLISAVAYLHGRGEYMHVVQREQS